MSVNTLLATDRLGASQDAVTLDLAGYGTVSIQITGTFSGTVSFQGTLSGTWVALNATPINGSTVVTSATSTGLWSASVSGLRSVRALMSSYTSGAAVVTLQAVTAGGGGASSGGGGGGGGAVTIADGADVAEGATTDPAATDSTSAWSVVALLKGVWALLNAGAGSAVTIADGADVAEGATTDTKITGDNAGTVSAKLRGLTYYWGLVIDTVNSWVKVSVQNATLAVTQSGSWVLSAGSAIIGKVSIDQTTPGTTNGVQTLSGSTTAVTQATASSLNATVVGTGTFATQATLQTGSAQIGHLEANQSVNLAQVAGATTATGHGTASGAVRVELPTDGTGVVGLAAGSAVIGHVVTDSGSTTAVTQGTATNLKAQAEAYQGGTAVGTGNPLQVSLANTGSNSTSVSAILTTGSAQIGHLEANQSSNVAQINGVTPLMGNGATGTGALRVSIASDSTGIVALTTGSAQIGHLEANQSTNIAQINGVTPLMGNGATGTGALRVSIASDSTGIVALNPTTAGGWSIFNATSGDGSTALTNSAQAIKASAGQLGGWFIYNPNSVVAYVPIYNVASGSVTVGTTNPAMVLAIPAFSAANVEIANGLAFGTAISAAACTTAAGNTALTTALDANFWYK